ncbi:hypothetical protein ULMA_13790 [Patiriisocius marinus]|uniref:OmpA-like domain-containing protein n=2 Tax=Patiriisocius marinus TaxID=1397112 RepID=A0A5J4J0E1_9FLAO|nr:hypothetical protein ULMA_13790 [Patiriisocius marinus]
MHTNYMKNFILAFFIFLVWTTFGLWIYSWLSSDDTVASVNNELIEDLEVSSLNETIEPIIETIKPIDSIIPPEIVEPIAVGLVARAVSNDTLFSFIEGISFKKDSVGIIVPESSIDYKYELNNYLYDNPDLELHVLSVYSPLERLEDSNLGVQRGDLIVKELVATGIESKKIVVVSVIEDIEFDKNEIYNKGITFQFSPLDQNRIAALKPKFVETPKKIIFYPNFSDTGILQNDELDNLMYKVKDIMDANPATKLIITGHTDDVGDSQDNHLLGLNYAKEMRWYFKNKGDINPSRMKAMSMGEFRPLRNNKTASGRRINRRVELQFTK